MCIRDSGIAAELYPARMLSMRMEIERQRSVHKEGLVAQKRILLWIKESRAVKQGTAIPIANFEARIKRNEAIARSLSKIVGFKDQSRRLYLSRHKKLTNDSQFASQLSLEELTAWKSLLKVSIHFLG